MKTKAILLLGMMTGAALGAISVGALLKARDLAHMQSLHSVTLATRPLSRPMSASRRLL
jgi:hypothetical protein